MVTVTLFSIHSSISLAALPKLTKLSSGLLNQPHRGHQEGERGGGREGGRRGWIESGIMATKTRSLFLECPFLSTHSPSIPELVARPKSNLQENVAES